MPYIEIVDANGDTDNIATSQVTRDGVTENLELMVIADPLSALQASVTAAGTSGTNALGIQGVSGGLSLPVTASVNGSSNVNITSVQATITSTTLLAANPNRLGLILFNAGPSVAYISYGSINDANTNYSFSIAPGQPQYVDSIPWRGQMTTITSEGAAQIQVTELS